MRFYVLSDLHLKKDNELDAIEMIKKVCEKIRISSKLDETILFFILGDVADKGNAKSFDLASACLNTIRSELRNYKVVFEFVPGNHDLINNNLKEFDDFTASQGNYHSFEKEPVYSKQYENVNFIFADSNLSRDPSSPGRIDINGIRSQCKSNMTNVLLFHHGLTFEDDDDKHNLIENPNKIIEQLKDMPIQYFFHGHKHYASIYANDFVDIGCGCFCEEVDWKAYVFNQFIVGYIDSGIIVKVERWGYSGDSRQQFMSETLYPSPKDFDDPAKINKINYSKPDKYISRTVSLYEDMNKSEIQRYFDTKPKKNLFEVITKDHNKIFLLADAGMGKSLECKNLAFMLHEKFHTFLYSLENYNGETIQDLIPEQYRKLPRQYMALLFDGYDELDEQRLKHFEIELNEYSKKSPEIRILITSRKNYCKKVVENESKTFPGFFVYGLDLLKEHDIKYFLRNERIDYQDFLKCAQAKNVHHLVFNPFYFEHLFKMYNEKHVLPNRNELMKDICESVFDLDDAKYKGNLDERCFDINKLLSQLAITMQLMHVVKLADKDEFQSLFSYEDRKLIVKSGILIKDGNNWRFLHNNFREYYAAKYLSEQNQEFVIKTIACESGIKPQWVNVLSFLTGFELDWDLKSWLSEKEPAALVKYSSKQLDSSIRFSVFEHLFEKYENMHIHFDEDLCTEQELADFSCSKRTLNYLFDRIKNPRNWESQYTALNLLRFCPDFYGKEAEIQNILLKCCEENANSNKMICRLAMMTLGTIKVNENIIATKLMNIFENNNEDYIRLGMYEYLYQTNLVNDYVEYCLSGIKLIDNYLDNQRIANESSMLESCLRELTSKNSILRLIEYFINDKIEMYSTEKILDECIKNMADLYIKGEDDIFDSMLNLYLEAKKKLCYKMYESLTQFFKLTNTMNKALLITSDRTEGKLHYVSNLVNPGTIEYLAENYSSLSPKAKVIFHKIVIRYVRDENEYKQYAKLIEDADGTKLPDFERDVDYQEMKIQENIDFCDVLMDDNKLKEIYMQLIENLDDPSVTNRQLKKVELNCDIHSVLNKLRLKMYKYEVNVRVDEFFEKINIDDFVLVSIYDILDKDIYNLMSNQQKERLIKIVLNMLRDGIYKDCVKYDENSVSINSKVIEILAVLKITDYTVEEDVLIDFTELPYFAFDNSKVSLKYDYLCSKLSVDKILNRLVQNVKEHKVKGMVLEDHLCFLGNHKDSRLEEIALNICKNTDDVSLRSSALDYLYKCDGVEGIVDEVLPFANENLLYEISFRCKDIPKERMREAMEREYKKEYSFRLQADLIKLGSTKALNDYVQKVSRDKRPFEDKFNRFDGPTEAIASIRNSEFLPQLKILLETVLDKAYTDSEYVNLKGSLTQALISCGSFAYLETTGIIKELQPSIEEDEDNFVYCNYILNGIETERKRVVDTVYDLKAVKKLLNENASI